MSAEESKKVVTEFLGRISRTDLDGVAAMLDDNVDWWVTGGEYWPFSGQQTRDGFLATSGKILDMFPKGLRMEPISMIAEGNKVAVEVQGHSMTAKGKAYDNRYHFLFGIKDGKIAMAREYMDTLYAKHRLLDD